MPKNSAYRGEVPPPTQTVRTRVRELLDSHPDVSKTEFARAIGQDPSFVSKFLSGERDAKDLILLVRIARFFGVSVAWLIGETPRERDAMLQAIVSAVQELQPEHQQVVLNVARSLLPATPPATDGSPPVGHQNTPRKRR